MFKIKKSSIEKLDKLFVNEEFLDNSIIDKLPKDVLAELLRLALEELVEREIVEDSGFDIFDIVDCEADELEQLIKKLRKNIRIGIYD